MKKLLVTICLLAISAVTQGKDLNSYKHQIDGWIEKFEKQENFLKGFVLNQSVNGQRMEQTWQFIKKENDNDNFILVIKYYEPIEELDHAEKYVVRNRKLIYAINSEGVHYFDENGQPSGGHGRTDIFYVDNEKIIDHIAIGYHHPKPDAGEKLLRQYRERMKILDKHLEYNDL